MSKGIGAHANKIAEDKLKVDIMACHLLFKLFLDYQEESKIPEMISYYVQVNHIRREHIQVSYFYEHKDESLPHLKDPVSDTQDPMKSKIMGYLRTYCILSCPGIIIEQKFRIGEGNGSGIKR